MVTENPIPFAMAGASRILTKDQIAAEYGERAMRPIPAGYVARKNRSAAARMIANEMLRFSVYKVHETGACEFIKGYRTWEEADEAAGKMRDTMTDAECGLDFTYEARKRTKEKADK